MDFSVYFTLVREYKCNQNKIIKKIKYLCVKYTFYSYKILILISATIWCKNIIFDKSK